MDKEKQIEEMADILCESKNHNCNGEDCKCIKQATDLYNAGYRKIDKGSVVLSKEEYDTLKKAVNELITEERAREIAKEYFGFVTKQAVKAVLERVKAETITIDPWSITGSAFECVYTDDIDEIAKEFGVEIGE